MSQIKHLFELAGVAHLSKAKQLIERIELLEGFKEAQVEFSSVAGDETAKQAIDKFKQLKDRNQLQGMENNIDYWRKQGWDKFQTFVNTKSQFKSKTETKRSKTSGQSINLLENDRWLVVVPLDKDASCFHGKGSDWCTTKPMHDYFEDYYYDKNITLIYCLEKETGGMWAIATSTAATTNRMELFDKQDKSISESKFTEQTGLDPRELVTKAHTPNNIARIKESKQVYEAALVAVKTRLRESITGRDLALEQQLILVKNSKLSTDYIGKLYLANNRSKVVVPDMLVINAAKSEPVILQAVDNVSESALRSIVRSNPKAIKFIESPSEAVQTLAVQQNFAVYALIDNPTARASWWYLLTVMDSSHNSLGDLPRNLQQMISQADPQFQKLMVERGSHAIRLVDNPTEQTKRAVLSDDRFADIRSRLITKWKINNTDSDSAIVRYLARKTAIDSNIELSKVVWAQSNPTTTEQYNELLQLAASVTEESDRLIRMFKREGSTQEHADVYNKLVEFSSTWDRKLAEWEAKLGK